MIHKDIEKAYQVLDGKPLSKELALKLIQIKGEDVLDLVSLANKVKNKFCKNLHICSIMNAKSGACVEDCKYCAQSNHNKAHIDVYGLKNEQEILKEAIKTKENGVKHFGIVTSGTGYKENNKEFRTIINAIHLIHKKLPDMNVCASLGSLGEENAKQLADANVIHYNINIQVNPKKYKDLIATTHTVDDRIQTIKYLKKHGIKVCSGGILGLGETMEDRIEMAYALKDLDVDVIPLNVLIPIEGTPLENQPFVPVNQIAKTFAIIRLIHPHKYIKFAAGRETRMKDFQGFLMLAGANGMLTGGYLTTRGRSTEDDKQLMEEINQF